MTFRTRLLIAFAVTVVVAVAFVGAIVSTEKVTRRTGEKMASTGMTPIVADRLLRSAET